MSRIQHSDGQLGETRIGLLIVVVVAMVGAPGWWDGCKIEPVLISPQIVLLIPGFCAQASLVSLPSVFCQRRSGTCDLLESLVFSMLLTVQKHIVCMLFAAQIAQL